MSARISSAKTGLTLYHFHHSFYSQKVWLTLLEKNVPFTEVLLNTADAHQYVPWFLEINPRGEVPVLKHDTKIIVDSANIIDYLENNFSDGEFKPLTPKSEGPDVIALAEEIRRKIDKVDANIHTFGCAFHPEMTGEKHYPYTIAGVFKSIRDNLPKQPEFLLNVADKNPKFAPILRGKAEKGKVLAINVANKQWFEGEMKSLTTFIESLEKQLMFRKPGTENWWLCSESFTQADVSLTILLYRLWLIGLEHRTFGVLPHLQSYFSRACQRPAFKEMSESLWKKDVMLFARERKVLLLVITVSTLVLSVGSGIYFWTIR